MKVAIVVQGGFHAFDLARALIGRGHDVTAFTNYPAWATACSVSRRTASGVIRCTASRAGRSPAARDATLVALSSWIEQLGLTAWSPVHDQLRYPAQEARHLAATPVVELSRADRVRRAVILAPPLVFAYALVGQRLVFDSWPGWYYTLQRTIFELLLSLRLVEARLRR